MKEIFQEYDYKMKRTIDVVMSDFAAVRAGRANPAVLDKITVEYYGSETPLQQVAAIAAPDPRTLTIQPWDATLLKAIEKAILSSDLGLNPQNDGKIIRLSFPQLTEERRRDLTKQVKKYGESGKVAIRNVRRDAVEKFKAMKKKSEITEDDLKEYEKELQDLTDKRCRELDDLTAKKEAELLEL
jgi:ribosome recycling factor